LLLRTLHTPQVPNPIFGVKLDANLVPQARGPPSSVPALTQYTSGMTSMASQALGEPLVQEAEQLGGQDSLPTKVLTSGYLESLPGDDGVGGIGTAGPLVRELAYTSIRHFHMSHMDVQIWAWVPFGSRGSGTMPWRRADLWEHVSSESRRKESRAEKQQHQSHKREE
ncbi:hypothetical protein E4U43_003976, partial [Claviceps pusilla]